MTSGDIPTMDVAAHWARHLAKEIAVKNWKLSLGLFCIFTAGIGIGAIGTGLVLRHKAVSVLNEGPPAVIRLVAKRLTRQLDLSPQQQVVVGKTLQETQQRLIALRSRYQPETRKIIGDGIAQIRQELSPEQQAKLDTLRERMRARFASF